MTNDKRQIFLHTHSGHSYALFFLTTQHFFNFIHQSFTSQVFTDDTSFFIQHQI